jgi:hypothetical protein
MKILYLIATLCSCIQTVKKLVVLITIDKVSFLTIDLPFSVRTDHSVDALQGKLVRGDDQQPKQVGREGNVLEHRGPKDLHRL